MATKKHDDDAVAETATEAAVPGAWPYDADLAKQQQHAYFLQQYVDLAIRAETLIGASEAGERVRDGLDRLKAMADALLEA